MKPLTKVDTFLKRFDNFKHGELRSIEVISPTTMQVTLAGQDTARAFDWISMKLELSEVSDAKLLDSSKLSLVDMDSGISIVKTDDTLTFVIGEYDSPRGAKDSICFIVCSNIKYEEGLF